MCAECLSMVGCRESVIKPRKNKDIRGKTKICKIKLKCSWFATARRMASVLEWLLWAETGQNAAKDI